jgi:hypothetical protein
MYSLLLVSRSNDCHVHPICTKSIGWSVNHVKKHGAADISLALAT